MSEQGIHRQVLEALNGVPVGRVEVVGQTPIADALRRRFASASRQARRGATFATRRRGAPLAIVETTGSAQGIAAALARVASRGTVVLAGDRASQPLPLNLYPDVHLRGVRMIGIRSELN